MRFLLTILCLISACGIAAAGPQHDENLSCEEAAAAQITPPMFYTRDGFGMWADSATLCGTRKFTIKNFHAVRDGIQKSIWCPKKCRCDPPNMAEASIKKCGNSCRCR